ncbi:MAG TPA: hypothetical protein VHL85_06440 [Burkholderiales bacterium]|nr:hypothetical protein [Burkholderiales bacterium]
MRLSLVKTAVDESGDLQIAREAHWLRELQGVAELDGQVPRLLDEGTSPEGRRYIVMSLPPENSGETRAFTRDHARFLASLGKARFRASDFELSGCGHFLQRSLDELTLLSSPGAVAPLQAAFDECESALLYWTGPYVLSQGDFAPWNIRTLDAQLFVFDWGHARTDASPLDDVLHYLMIQRALRARPVSVAFLQGAMKSAHAFAVQAYPEWSWRPRVIGALTVVYLLGTVLHHALAKRRLSRQDAAVGTYLGLLEKRRAWMPD